MVPRLFASIPRGRLGFRLLGGQMVGAPVDGAFGDDVHPAWVRLPGRVIGDSSALSDPPGRAMRSRRAHGGLYRGGFSVAGVVAAPTTALTSLPSATRDAELGSWRMTRLPFRSSPASTTWPRRSLARSRTAMASMVVRLTTEGT